MIAAQCYHLMSPLWFLSSFIERTTFLNIRLILLAKIFTEALIRQTILLTQIEETDNQNSTKTVRTPLREVPCVLGHRTRKKVERTEKQEVNRQHSRGEMRAMKKMGGKWENGGKRLKNSPSCHQLLKNTLCSPHGQHKWALQPTSESEKFTV